MIIAHHNSKENVYIQSCKINGEPYDKLYFTHEQLMSGMTVEFEMGSEPSSWAIGEDAKPTSMTTADEGIASSYTDLTKGRPGELFDDDSLTFVNIVDGTRIGFMEQEAKKVELITLACNRKDQAPTAFAFWGSHDGEHYELIMEEEGITFLFDNFIRPFEVKTETAYRYYQLYLYGGSELSEIELLA